MNLDLSTTANLLGDPGRAAILLSLLGGIALPAGELAHIAHVAPQTASAHLARLVDGRLLTVERQGRHRYYRLAGIEVADAMEALLVLTAPPKSGEKGACIATAGSLAHARTCYAHLAGWLGVRIAEALEERALLSSSGMTSSDAKAYTLTPSGKDWFAALGIEVKASELNRPRLARRCLDWTERRHHLAGTLGCAMYSRFQELRWVAPVRGTRAVRVTVEGKMQLWKRLRIPSA